MHILRDVRTPRADMILVGRARPDVRLLLDLTLQPSLPCRQPFKSFRKGGQAPRDAGCQPKERISIRPARTVKGSTNEPRADLTPEAELMCLFGFRDCFCTELFFSVVNFNHSQMLPLKELLKSIGVVGNRIRKYVWSAIEKPVLTIGRSRKLYP
jgi:hypothetical protein